MTPRGTDWSLASLVALGFGTGLLTLFAGAPGDAWVFALHGAAGIALGLVLAWKLPRVLPRLADRARWDRRMAAGAFALALVAAALGSGIAWSSGARVYPAGYSLLAWHFALGAALAMVVVGHAVVRAKRPRRRDVVGRRQFLAAGGVALGAFLAWEAQRPFQALVGLRGARRRFTGSYESASFEGNAFPTTSWVADSPREIAPDRYRLRVEGLVAKPLDLGADELDAGDERVAILDCTGGFYSKQRWRGISFERLLALAGPLDSATDVRVISRTGYRWSYPLSEAPKLLLATHVGGAPLSHGHGAPARLVAPGHRGFEWVKWVERIELRDGPDYGAPVSTLLSSFTAAGRGDS